MAIPQVPYPFNTWESFFQATLQWPYCYPTAPFQSFIPGVAIKNSFNQVIDGRVNQAGAYVEFDYPVFQETVAPVVPSSSLSYRYYLWWTNWAGWYFNFYNPVMAAGFHVQIIEGSWSNVQANYPRPYWDVRDPQRYIYVAANDQCRTPPPGRVVYEGIQHFLPEGGFSTYLNLATQGAKGRLDIPGDILQPGVSYTARVRILVTSPYLSAIWFNSLSTLGGYTLNWNVNLPAFITMWGSSSFKVNEAPIASALTINGEASPQALPRSSKVALGFTIQDADGPRLYYRVQVGQQFSSGFVATKWDTGVINGGTPSLKKTFELNYAGAALSPGTQYAWRVQPGDGIIDGEWSSLQSFRINQLPIVTSAKIDGNELLTSTPPVVKSSNPTFSWTYHDPDGGTQKAFRIEVSSISNTPGEQGATLFSAERFSGQSSIVLPVLPDGAQIQIRLAVRDDVEYGNTAAFTFRTNTTPVVRALTVDGERNPTNVSTTTPTFAWDFFDEDNDAQAAYRIQVATDQDFSSLVWDTGSVSGASTSVVYGSTGSPLVGPVALAHAQGIYFARIQASDGTSFSPFPAADDGDSEALAFFSINTPPGDPTILTPTSGAYEGTLEVTWAEASPVDADGDDVYYTIEMTSRASSGTGWVQVGGPLPSPTTSFDLDLSGTPAGDDYAIRIIASDQYSQSNPDNGGTSARFSILNHAPRPPAFSRPGAGSINSVSLLIEWVEADPVDVDGDAVTYTLELTRDFSASDPTWEKIGIFPAGTSRHVLRVDEHDDGTHYNIRIRATDQHGAMSDYVYTGEFTIANSIIAQDFQRLNGELYIGTSDGRVYKVTEPYWQVEETWSKKSEAAEFEEFKSGMPVVEIRDGKLFIRAPSGSTYVLRQSKRRDEA